MTHKLARIGLCATLCCAAGAAAGDVTYLTQARSVTVLTSANNATQTLAAPDFGPFNATANLATTFPTPGGGSSPNEAVAGIDCQLDPNAIRVIGSLSGSGGLSIIGGNQVLQFAEAAARVQTLFHVSAGTPFRLTASPRPIGGPNDRFKIKLKNETTSQVLLELDETMPPQSVDFSGLLDAADIEFEFQMELMVDGPESLAGFAVNLTLGQDQCYANCDGGTAAPVLNVDDFTCFLNRFASADPFANCDQSTSPPILNINDFMCFLRAFAVGCS